MMRLADDAILAGDGDEFAADGGRGCFGRAGVGDGRCGPCEVEGHPCQDQPGGVRGEHARRRMRQCAVLQVRVDELDDRVSAVGFDGGDCGQVAGREERVEAVRIKEGGMFEVFLVQLRDPPHREAPCGVFTLLGG